MLSKSAKLHWGLGHKSLKTVYEGALTRLMTYGAPVWEEVVAKQRYLRKMQNAQRLINIKIAIGIAIAGKALLYNRKHGIERSQYECDMSLPVTEWPHPARRVTIMEKSE
jgi:hypothetical protein